MAAVSHISEIPFLPISVFKNHKILTGDDRYQAIFKSSGTTGQLRSQHYIKDVKQYLKNASRGFEQFYGPISQYAIYALLPSYVMQGDSSLVAMVDHFIGKSIDSSSGFHLDDFGQLSEQLRNNNRKKIKTILIGVSYALLDLAEKFTQDLSNIIIMETGGMKGRREEMTKQKMHKILKKAFKVASIHSEYGMTELCSQAYSSEDGIFKPSYTMRAVVKELNDPFAVEKNQKVGVLNIIDLANIDSCAFIETEDLGISHPKQKFEVVGRLHERELRGCNLLYQI